MSTRVKRILLLVLAAVLLLACSRIQRSLNADRDRLGLTHIEPLDDAPPVLAFTTVALGGFRGLLSNLLWIRANDLQQDDKFFEMAQLADWIGKLEPHFPQVWTMQAWNMAYNISVKFHDPADRWNWVQRGIELLRDQGLRYNPNDILIHRELGWFFQHKMGADLDDANKYYKEQWRQEMTRVFGSARPNFDELIHPQTADQTNRANLLRDKYKMDPVLMKEVDQEYGPLEWRLPEASAIYWAAEGLKEAKAHPEKVKADDFIMLRRIIYQSMQTAFHRGRLIESPYMEGIAYGPNLDIIPKVVAAYEQAMDEDAPNRDHISKAHRNILREAVYFLYMNNRRAEAEKWFQYLAKKYPNLPIIDGKPDSLPGKVTLDDYAFACAQVDINETSHDKVQAMLEGIIRSSYGDLILDQDEHAAGMMALAQRILDKFERSIGGGASEQRVGLPPLAAMEKEVRDSLLSPSGPLPPEARAKLRTKLRMGPEPAPATSPATNTVSQTAARSQ